MSGRMLVARGSREVRNFRRYGDDGGVFGEAATLEEGNRLVKALLSRGARSALDQFHLDYGVELIPAEHISNVSGGPYLRARVRRAKSAS